MSEHDARVTTNALRERWFGGEIHPYRVMEQAVRDQLQSRHVLLDAGCGRTAPVLTRFRGKAARLVGIDLVEFRNPVADCELYRRDLAATGLPPQAVDIIYSQSVFEHLTDPIAVLSEFRRILRPGGRCIVLTANLWDYATLISILVPNRFHPRIVARTEGRASEDVFPAHYRCNTRRAVGRCASAAGLHLKSFQYLGQYPAYFLFSPTLFTLASAYEKLIRSARMLHVLQGWILFTLEKPTTDSSNA